jgi:hypothetical protein
MNKFFRFSLIFVLFLFVEVSAFAQCAMCRASVENNVSNGDTSIGAGLNTGILYLFVMPYLLAGIIGFFWWKSAKKKKVKLV